MVDLGTDCTGKILETADPNLESLPQCVPMNGVKQTSSPLPNYSKQKEHKLWWTCGALLVGRGHGGNFHRRAWDSSIRLTLAQELLLGVKTIGKMKKRLSGLS